MQSLVRRAVELAKTDGEFRIASREWTGTLRIVVDEQTHVVKMEAGRATSVATDDAGDAPIPGEVVLAGPAAVWEQMLVAVPRPFYQDIQGAGRHGFVLGGDPQRGAQYLAALQRFVGLLRAAREEQG